MRTAFLWDIRKGISDTHCAVARMSLVLINISVIFMPHIVASHHRRINVKFGFRLRLSETTHLRMTKENGSKQAEVATNCGQFNSRCVQYWVFVTYSNELIL